MNYLALILFNIVFFICNLYPKHIFEIGSALSVISIALNIVFYIAFFWFLSVVFKRNKTLFSSNTFSPLETFSEKLCIKPILILFATQIFFDIAYIVLSQTIKQNCIYFADIFTLAQWIIIYCVYTKKQKNIFSSKKSFVIIAIVLFVLLSISMYGNILINNFFIEYSNKYDPFSYLLLTATKNLDFVFQLKNLFFDTLIGILLLLSHSLLLKEKSETEDKKIAKTIIRFSVCVFVAMLLVFLKTLIMPNNSLTGYNVKGDNTSVYEDRNDFYANTEILTIKRGKDMVFQTTKNKIYYNKTLVKEFITVDGMNATSTEINGNQMTIIDCFEDKTINGVDIKVYKNMAVCYVKEGNPMVVICDTDIDLSNDILEHIVTE